MARGEASALSLFFMGDTEGAGEEFLEWWDDITPWETQNEQATERAKQEKAAVDAEEELNKIEFDAATELHGIRTERLAGQRDAALEGLGLDETDLRGDYDLAMQDFADALDMLDHAKTRATERIGRQQAGATTAAAAFGVRGGSSYDHIEHVAEEATADVTEQYDHNVGKATRTADKLTRQFATTGGSDDLFSYYGVESQEELELVLAAKGLSAPEFVEQGRFDIARSEINENYTAEKGILDKNLTLAEAGSDYNMAMTDIKRDRIDYGLDIAAQQQFASLLTGAANVASIGLGLYGQAAAAGLFSGGAAASSSTPQWFGGGATGYMQSQAPAYRW